ncbi:putative bifunctional diguanylate cyclase/phosphodiesterase [Marinomonas colpomeniae]|uniref:EAL domain-containing protein n=1 Tax=Marinomonas colpomeniae TaxID=2774408 RepID=A0ABR8P3B9_9GAMM|nr:EAL domain-containing protein [Marinomonas colpomeniae]MBD5772345.1 EAL domain-containing protein [Marinomonas colpomeniae]
MPVDLQKLHTAIWIYDIDHSCVVWANQAALKLWNSPSLDELVNRDIKTGQSVAVKESLLQYQQAFKKGQVIQENWSYSPKGKNIEAFCQFSGIETEDGRMAMLVEATTSELNSHIKLGATTILSVHSMEGQFISGNPPFIKSFGEEGLSLSQLFCDPDTFIDLKDSTLEGHRFEKDVLMNTPKGETWFRVFAIHNHNEQEQSTLLLHHYNIHERKTLEQNLRQQAWSDPLTGLLNRRGLTHKLEKNIENETPFSIFYIDLDGFKMVNDSLGHNLGDDVLIEVCQRLKQACHQTDTLCRFGGDEFIVVSYQNTSRPNNEERYQVFLDCLSDTYQTLQGKRLSISASIGIAHYPTDGIDIQHIITCADAAMYQAKKQGKKCWVEYQNGMELKLKRISHLSQNLALADKNEEFTLHYQPIVDVSSGRIVSFEALLRWSNEELGEVGPEEVIRIAEETGLIYELEDWVLDRAICDLVKLKELVTPDVTMAVNLSGLHLLDINLAERILQILSKNSLKPHDLTIELTETVLVCNINSESSPTRTLIESGIKVSIDDFGTGYSSLAYLHTIPASTVKIDKSFLDSTKYNTTTLECIYRLVTTLNMDCLIEGIETQQQADLLRSIGYNLQQGYFHGKPKPIEYYHKSKI